MTMMYPLPSVLASAAAVVVALLLVASASAGVSYRARFGGGGGGGGTGGMARQYAFGGAGSFPSASPFGGAPRPSPQAGAMNFGFPGFGGGAHGLFGGGGGGGGGMGGGGGAAGGGGGGRGGGGGLAGVLGGILPAVTGMLPGVLSMFGGGGGGGAPTNFGNGGGGMPAGANQGSGGGGFPTASQPGATGGGGGVGGGGGGLGDSALWSSIGGLIANALPLILNLFGGGGGGANGRGRSNVESGRMTAAAQMLNSKLGSNFTANDPAFQTALRNALQRLSSQRRRWGREAEAEGGAGGGGGGGGGGRGDRGGGVIVLPATSRSRRQALNPQIKYECPYASLNMTECARMDRVGLTECTSKSDCGGEEFCCLGGKYGCDFVCAKPIMPEIVHPGSCPSISMTLLMKEDTKYLFESCSTECRVDEDCGSNEKCCDYILGECQQNVCLKAA